MFNKLVNFSFMSCLLLGMLVVSPAWADKGIQKEVIKRDRLRCGVTTGAIGKMESLYCKAVALAVLEDATKVDLISYATVNNRYQGARHDPAVDQSLWVDVSFATVGTTVGTDGAAQGVTYTSPVVMNRFVPMGRISSTSGQSVLSSPSAFMAIRTPAGLGAYFVANPNDRMCVSATPGLVAAALAAGIPSTSINQPASGPASYNADNGGANGVPCHAVVSTNLTLMASTGTPGNFLANVTLEHQTFAGYTRDVKELEANGVSRQADKGDQKWTALVNAIVNGVQTAAMYGVDSSNVTAMCNLASPVPHDHIAQLLGITNTLSPPQAGETVGLRNDWACDVIAQLGNYDQFWDAIEAELFATSGVIMDQATFYNGFNRLFQDPSGLPTGGLIVPIAPSAF